jgi:alpha-glucosidase
LNATYQMYGYHPVYYESRSDNSSGQTDTHVVFYLNTAGMDVILRPGVIQYRAIGGALDFYFFSGDSTSQESAAHKRDIIEANVEVRAEGLNSRSVLGNAVIEMDKREAVALDVRKRSNGKINSAITAIEQYVQTIGLPQVPPAWGFGEKHLCLRICQYVVG